MIFCYVDVIVCAATCDLDLGHLCLILKSKQGAYIFIGSEAKLMVEGNEISGSIIEDGASFEGGVGILVAIVVIEVLANNTGNILVRKNMLTREQLIM